MQKSMDKIGFLAIRMVLDNHHKHNRSNDEDDTMFAYLKVLENVDHHNDFKNSQFYTIPPP